MTPDKEYEEDNTAPGNNKDKKDYDKAPGEGIGEGEKVTTADLKGKKVDADPGSEDGKPAEHE